MHVVELHKHDGFFQSDRVRTRVEARNHVTQVKIHEFHINVRILLLQ
jgi:hypothetical protein